MRAVVRLLPASVACAALIAVLGSCASSSDQPRATNSSANAGVGQSSTEAGIVTSIPTQATESTTGDAPATISDSTEASTLPASTTAEPKWTVEEAAGHYVEAVKPYNKLIGEWNLAGPAYDGNLQELTALAEKLAAADVDLKDVVDRGEWPDVAAEAAGSLAAALSTDIDFWTKLSETSDPKKFENAVRAHFSGTAGAEAAAFREALQLPPSSPTSQIGKTAHNWGVTVTITGIKIISKVPSDDGTRAPDAGGVFVAVDTEVTNDAKKSMDLTCGYPIGNALIDSDNRQYDAVDDLYLLPGNPECNANLQPGFTHKMRYVYMVPKSVMITSWGFNDFTDLSSGQRPTFIALNFAAE